VLVDSGVVLQKLVLEASPVKARSSREIVSCPPARRARFAAVTARSPRPSFPERLVSEAGRPGAGLRQRLPGTAASQHA